MKGNRLKILIHLTFWAVLLILPWFMVSGNLEQPGYFEGRYYIRVVSGGILFYITYLWLVPELYLTNRKVHFFVAVTLLIVTLYGASDFLSHWIFPDDELMRRLDRIREKMASEGMDFKGPPPPFRYLNALITSTLVAGIAMGLRIAEAYTEKEKQNQELEKARLAADLGLLKSQISPHFFFNTLNNIYVLTESNSPDAGTAILKLSKMMRYVLYESGPGLTTLGEEIGFMNHYIDLMRLRLTDKVNIKVDFRPHSEEIPVTPLIFISLIENAFKHGISYREPSFINISLHSTPDEIRFTCSNSRHPRPENPDDVRSGIGLGNIRKRLSLIYPDRHQLLISEDAAVYNVSLTIQPNPK